MPKGIICRWRICRNLRQKSHSGLPSFCCQKERRRLALLFWRQRRKDPDVSQQDFVRQSLCEHRKERPALFPKLCADRLILGKTAQDLLQLRQKRLHLRCMYTHGIPFGQRQQQHEEEFLHHSGNVLHRRICHFFPILHLPIRL